MVFICKNFCFRVFAPTSAGEDKRPARERGSHIRTEPTTRTGFSFKLGLEICQNLLERAKSETSDLRKNEAFRFVLNRQREQGPASSLG